MHQPHVHQPHFASIAASTRRTHCIGLIRSTFAEVHFRIKCFKAAEIVRSQIFGHDSTTIPLGDDSSHRIATEDAKKTRCRIAELWSAARVGGWLHDCAVLCSHPPNLAT